MPRVSGLVLVLVISTSCFADAAWRLLSAEPARRIPQDAAGIPQIFDGVPTGDYPAVAGVTSGGYPDCPGILSWDTNVVPFLPWIDAHLQ